MYTIIVIHSKSLDKPHADIGWVLFY